MAEISAAIIDAVLKQFSEKIVKKVQEGKKLTDSEVMMLIFSQAMQAVRAEISGLRQEMNGRMDGLNSRMDGLEKRIEAVDSKVDSFRNEMNGRMDGLN
ncbi:hypothetical protein, partial [Sulfodiicoccus acidiphilus]